MFVDLTQLPSRLKRLRESTGHSQMDLARMCGMTQAQVSAYEVGKSHPNLESTISLCTAFGISVAALLDEKEPTRAPPRPPTKFEMAIWILEAIGLDGFPLERVRAVLIEKDYRKSV